jgi:chromosome segregation ATPase
VFEELRRSQKPRNASFRVQDVCLQNDAAVFRGKCAALESEHEQLSTENVALKTVVSQNEETISNLKQSLRSVEEEFNSLNRLDLMNLGRGREVFDLKSAADISNERDLFSCEHDALDSADREAGFIDYERQTAQVRAEFDALREKLSPMVSICKDWQSFDSRGKLAGIMDDGEGLVAAKREASERAALNIAVIQYERNLNALEQSMKRSSEAFDKAIAERDRQVAQAVLQLDSLRQEVSSRALDKDKLAADLMASSNDIVALKNVVNLNEETIAHLKQSLHLSQEQFSSESVEWNHKHAHANSQLDVLRQELSSVPAHIQTISELQAETASLKTDISHLQQACAEKDATIRSVRQSLQEERDSKRALEAEISPLEANLAHMRKAIAEKDIAISNLQQQLQEEQNSKSVVQAEILPLESNLVHLRNACAEKDVTICTLQERLQEEQDRRDEMTPLEADLLHMRRAAVEKDLTISSLRQSLQAERDKSADRLANLSAVETELANIHAAIHGAQQSQQEWRNCTATPRDKSFFEADLDSLSSTDVPITFQPSVYCESLPEVWESSHQSCHTLPKLPKIICETTLCASDGSHYPVMCLPKSSTTIRCETTIELPRADPVDASEIFVDLTGDAC